MNWGSTPVPLELQKCPREVLERYVRTRILAVAGGASVSRRLGVGADTVRQVFAEILNEAASLRGLDEADAAAEGPQLQLSFGHDCQSLGCLENGCPLCVQNPNRRCSGNFSTKYLSGDVLKAKCGASIRVEVVDRATLEPVKGEAIEDIYLEMCILDGKAYAAQQDAGREQYEEDVEACIIATNNQGKELLVPGRGATHNEDKWVVVQLSRGQAHLPDLTVTGSSEALLSGQKPPFRLLVRAMNATDNSRAADFKFLVSEAFVVATPRVRTAAKAEIPHLDDHVSKLHAVGNMTQNKLQDISSAAIAVGVYNIQVPYNTVTKVGQFKELVEVAEQDPQLCETLKKVLKLTRGWEVARDHAMMAVSTDNQMRIWYVNAAATAGGGAATDGGLLFKCHLGSVDLENPVGLLKKKEGAGGALTTLEATLIQRLAAGEKDSVKKLQKRASICWWQPGHPGWAVWPVDTQAFLQDMAAPAGILTAEHLITAATELQGKLGTAPQAERPMTRSAVQAQAAEAQSSVSMGNADSTATAQGNQLTRSSTPSEGGASLDGWMGASQQHPGGAAPLQPLQQQPGDPPPRGPLCREVKFPVQPSPKSSPVWANSPAAFGGPGLPGNLSAGAPPLGRMETEQPGIATTWDATQGIRQMQESAVGRMPNGSPRLPRGLQPLARGPALQRTWGDEASSLGPGNLGMPQLQHHPPLGAGQWSLPARQPQQQLHTHLRGPYAGLRDYAALAGSLQQYGMAAGGLQQMPSSGTVRKREADMNSRAVPLPGGESDPLPSPFGLPELQNMDLPLPAQRLPVTRARPTMDQRMSSGMEPAHAKRQHLSPAELQQRLSHLVGRPLGAQEMSRLIPNFPDLLEEHSSIDLPSMTLTTSDLAGLMDAMLEDRHKPAQAPAGTAPPRSDQHTFHGTAGPNDILKIDSYTYADLAEAVDLMHEGGAKHPQQPNAGLSEPRSSSMLMEYLSARLAGPEAQFLHGESSPASQAPREVHPGIADGQSPAKRGELLNSRSGLESMQSIEEALPTGVLPVSPKLEQKVSRRLE